MNENNTKLATRETAYAAEHHDLVYRFLEENGLDQNEYYDIIVFGYLESVKNYLRRAELQSYPFEHVAKKAMNASLGNYLRSMEGNYADISLISLSERTDGYGRIEETLCCIKDSIEEAINNIEWERTVSALDVEERRIVKLLADGYLANEIPKIIGITPSVLKDKLDSIRNALSASSLMAA